MNPSKSSAVVTEGILSWQGVADAVFVCSELTYLSKEYIKRQGKPKDHGFS